MFLLASGLRQNQTISVKEKAQASLTSDYSNSDQECTRGKNVESTAINTASTNIVVNTIIQPQVQ